MKLNLTLGQVQLLSNALEVADAFWTDEIADADGLNKEIEELREYLSAYLKSKEGR